MKVEKTGKRAAAPSVPASAASDSSVSPPAAAERLVPALSLSADVAVPLWW